jgi:hypothetical protein
MSNEKQPTDYIFDAAEVVVKTFDAANANSRDTNGHELYRLAENFRDELTEYAYMFEGYR